MNQEHLLIVLGVALFFAGLISGLIIPKLTLPRMGLTSHLEGTQNGMFLILVGLVWGRLDLSELWLQIAFCCMAPGRTGVRRYWQASGVQASAHRSLPGDAPVRQCTKGSFRPCS